MDKQNLIDFEQDIANLYKQGMIKAPVHLSGGNEDELIEIFKDVGKEDWLFLTYRSHFHWLLSGRDPQKLKDQILDGHSMHVYDDKFFTSAIVAGITPIALGVALALKLKKSKNKVFCFLGDMAAMTGLAKECFTYASGHALPIEFIIEDNSLSVNTKTRDVWGTKKTKTVKHYKYIRKFPHAGIGEWVLF